MPSYTKDDIILVQLPFSDLSESYSRPRFGLQSTNPIASLSKYPAKAISITASTGKSISIDRTQQ
jgi:hypothetical protein